MGCAPVASLVQRMEPNADKTSERPDPEANHSVRTLNAQDSAPTAPPERPVRNRIKWPPMNSSKWEAFESDVDQTLQQVLGGSISKRLETMATIIHVIGKNTFGTDEKPTKTKHEPPSKSRRELKIEHLRREIKLLKREYKNSAPEQRPALTRLKDYLHKQIISLRRAERLCKRSKRRARARQLFFEGPFAFVKNLLGSLKSGQLN